jgi:hypothetical protein
MWHDGCGGRAERVELISDIESATGAQDRVDHQPDATGGPDRAVLSDCAANDPRAAIATVPCGRIDRMMERNDHAATRKGIPARLGAAWAVLFIYAVLVILFAGIGITAKDSVESAFMFGYAAVLALLLSIMAPVLYIGTIRRNRVGPWICIVLGAVSLCLLTLLLTS